MAQVITQAAANESVWNSFTIIQAIGSIVTAVALVFIIGSTVAAWRSSSASRKATDLAARESRERFRPWVTFDGALPILQGSPERDANIFEFSFTNTGLLPAQNVVVKLDVLQQGATETSETRTQNLGLLFPSKTTTWGTDFSTNHQFSDYRGQNINVVISGRITYSFGERSYLTRFERTFDFKDPDDFGARERIIEAS